MREITAVLHFRFPEPVKIAVLIYGQDWAVAFDYGQWLVFQVNADTSVGGLQVDECNVMFREHWMRCASDLDQQSSVIHLRYYWNVFLQAGIRRAGNQFLHFLPAADHRDIGVHEFYDYIAAMTASEELY